MDGSQRRRKPRIGTVSLLTANSAVDETILANCKALLSLQLTNVDFQGSVAWVYGCVLGLPPARIPRVSCKLWADTPRDLDVLRWKALDTVFTRSHSAVSIVLHSWKSPDMEKMCREVERRLPALYNRRQLEVSSHGPARLGSGASMSCGDCYRD